MIVSDPPPGFTALVRQDGPDALEPSRFSPVRRLLPVSFETGRTLRLRRQG